MQGHSEPRPYSPCRAALRSGRHNLDQFDIEEKAPPGQRVICIEGDFLQAEIGDDNPQFLLVLSLQTQLETDLQVHFGRHARPVDRNDLVFPMGPESLFGGERGGLLVSWRHTDEGVLDAGQKLPLADHEAKRFLFR